MSKPPLRIRFSRGRANLTDYEVSMLYLPPPPIHPCVDVTSPHELTITIEALWPFDFEFDFSESQS